MTKRGGKQRGIHYRFLRKLGTFPGSTEGTIPNTGERRNAVIKLSSTTLATRERVRDGEQKGLRITSTQGIFIAGTRRGTGGDDTVKDTQHD